MAANPILRWSDPLPPIPAELEVEWREGWRKADSKLETDAIALWTEHKALPKTDTPEARARDLALGVYVKGRLAGVATGTIRHLAFLRRKFVMLRVFVAPDFRLNNINRWLAFNAIGVFERWSREHPEERVMGVASISQYKAEVLKAPILRGNLVVVGYTREGQQIRVAWFEHADVDV